MLFGTFIGLSPSGKAMDSDSIIRRFESFQPRAVQVYGGIEIMKDRCSNTDGNPSDWITVFIFIATKWRDVHETRTKNC